ncbi:endonuclease-reverse transcriptase [Plakobranchus ocellatus]|uniref:Endonuclease-reverse transcriptase n=1 Tax=Plakobranchus ocellatus TaxID=259542 RepID=A0AAV4B092_9GAST|nr:endonuclease-reverse transcriptase [Plakobranchus ocellatus]
MVIQSLYEKATSAVFLNKNTGGCFRTTIGVRQDYLLSPTLFNTFPKRIMTEALENHEGTVSIRGTLCFTDGMDGLAWKEQELAKLTE